MVGIDKLVALAGQEDSAMAAEHVMFEDDLKDVGMVDGALLGNNWAPVA